MINISQIENFTESGEGAGSVVMGKVDFIKVSPKKSGKNIIFQGERAEFTFMPSCGNKTKE
jgi:hypothetical protein